MIINKPESYRPITLLPTTSKVFEQLLLRTLSPHITPRAEQFGFRAEHSTTHEPARSYRAVLACSARPAGPTADATTDRDAASGTTAATADASSSTPPQPPNKDFNKKLRYPPLVVEHLPNWAHHLKELKARLGRAANARPFGKGIRFTPTEDHEHRLIQRYLTELEKIGAAIITTWFYLQQSPSKTKQETPPVPSHSNTRLLPFQYWYHRTLHPELYLDPSCTKFPSISDIKYAGNSWQVITVEGGSLYVQGAYCDDRFNDALVRIIGYADVVPLPKIFCQLWTRLTYAAPAWFALLSATNRQRLRAQQSRALRLVVGAPRFVRNDTIARDLRMESLDDHVRRLSTNLFERTERSEHRLIHGIAPYHRRPPDRLALPRDLIAANTGPTPPAPS
ncbi:uncharacterized protein LOC142984977 [Anticarsia gemmatalis]|uniref:uncharacterized protein LOC142984977 n=1 Tax=Anticarsia gemmatalis TaxID=129554 RepID=UPI003F764C80